MANESIVKVFHAARQDIEIVWHRAGLIPHPIFDTQVAAMVLGYGDSISYDQLVQRITGDMLDKSNRFTDWTRRPLTQAQLEYAVSDVTHLRDVYQKLLADLGRRGRTEWVSEEMDVLTSPDTYKLEPENAWQRLRTRVRKPKELAVLIEVAAWREREAQVARRSAPARAQGRSRRRHRRAGADHDRASRRLARAAQGVRAVEMGARDSGSGQSGTGARSEDACPSLERSRAAPNGAAIVELLKVLLRMTAEQHAVAAKVIATVDDLEQIAADDDGRRSRDERLAARIVRRKGAVAQEGPPRARARKRPRDRGGADLDSNEETSMAKLRVHCFSISLDGYGAGPNQSLDNPLGVGGEELHQWFVGTRTFKQMAGRDGGTTGIDDDFAARGFKNVGACILGRNMFGPVRGPWPDDSWKGWWGDNPPYHAPVFVLTHHPRPSITMDGGTTFHFVTDGFEAALARAKEAAKGQDVQLGGGAATIRTYLRARIDRRDASRHFPDLPRLGRASVSPVIDLSKLGYHCAEHVPTPNATHVVLTKKA